MATVDDEPIPIKTFSAYTEGIMLIDEISEIEMIDRMAKSGYYPNKHVYMISYEPYYFNMMRMTNIRWQFTTYEPCTPQLAIMTRSYDIIRHN